MLRAALLALALALPARASEPAAQQSAERTAADRPPAAPRTPWSKKELGVLLIGPAVTSWKASVGEAWKAFGASWPVDATVWPPSTRDLQRALERLKAARAQRIVVVPVALHSQSDEVEQLQYLLGLRKHPSEGLMKGRHANLSSSVLRRAKTKLPLAMTPALDDDPFVAKVLLERARELSRSPKAEEVVLAGLGSASDEVHELRLRRMQGLARRLEEEGGFRAVGAALLRPDAEAKPREAARKGLRAAVSEASRRGRTLVVPYLLSADGTEKLLRKELDGLFFQWKGRALLPDPGLAPWLQRRASEGLRLPDMVKFKDDGQALPGPEKKRFVR